MPAGLRRRAALLTVVAALLLAGALAPLAPPAHAADDSNSGPLTPTPTVSPQELNSALSSLAQGSNDTQLQQLISQFQSQLASGNYNGAASTLVQLKGLSNQQGASSPALNALLNSLSVGSNGASIDSNTLSSLLNANTGGSSASQQKLSLDMQTLASLMQYANSTLASQLLQSSGLLSQSAFSGSGGANGGAPKVSLPGVSSLPGISIPSVGAPSLSVGGPSGGLPAISPAAFAVPLLVAAVVAALFFSRGRVARLIGSQRLPGVPFLRGGQEAAGESGEVPTDPRKRIEFYFAKAVRLMGRRGVPKLDSETHREFSSKCETKPERPQVSAIASLYEKAKFSGQSVGSPDADSAAAALRSMGEEPR